MPSPAIHGDQSRDAAADHYALLQQLRSSGDGDPLSASAPTATIANPQWFHASPDGLSPTHSRDELHRSIIDDFLAHGRRTEGQPRAILLAGPPGAGKSTSLGDVFSRADGAITGGLSRGDFVVIDADSIKEKLISTARADGSLEAFIKPPVVRELEAGGESFSDLDFASLVHEESSMIAEQARVEAVARRLPVVLDQVCSSQAKTAQLVDSLDAASYNIAVVEIDASRDFSLESTFGRYVAIAETGGRARRVPTEVVDSVFSADGSSKPRASIEALLEREPCPVTAWRKYDATVVGRPPVLSETGQRNHEGVMRREKMASPQRQVRRTKADVLAGRDKRARELIAKARTQAGERRLERSR